MSDPVAMLAIVAFAAVSLAGIHAFTRRIRIDITNEIIESPAEPEDDPADFWKPKRGEQN